MHFLWINWFDVTFNLTAAIFLKIARNKEELQQEMSTTNQPSIVSPQPFFAHFSAVTSGARSFPRDSGN